MSCLQLVTSWTMMKTCSNNPRPFCFLCIVIFMIEGQPHGPVCTGIINIHKFTIK